MYLNEEEAKEAIENIAKKYTSDVKVYLLRRKPENLVKKNVFFGMKVSPKSGENFFNDFMIATSKSQDLEVIESEVIEENSKPKEIFLLKATIKVIGSQI